MEPVKIEVQLDELRKKHLFIATPAYSGGMHCSYVQSLLDLQRTLLTYGIPHTIQFMFNESLISRARNKLAELFLKSEATHLLFIDADIEFDPNDVLLLLHFDKDLIGGAYPLKTINWEGVKKAIAKNPDISAAELVNQGAQWSTHPFEGRMTMPAVTPIEVQELATGFMLISRKVFETLKPHVPTYTPPSNDAHYPNPAHDYFFVGVCNDRYESEDYSFCRRWRELDGQVWLCPWIKLNHFGSYGFRGDMISLANNLGEIS